MKNNFLFNSLKIYIFQIIYLKYIYIYYLFNIINNIYILKILFFFYYFKKNNIFILNFFLKKSNFISLKVMLLSIRQLDIPIYINY
jgi:hypothetical protein